MTSVHIDQKGPAHKLAASLIELLGDDAALAVMRTLGHELGVGSNGTPASVFFRIRDFDAVRAVGEQQLPGREVRPTIERLERIREVAVALALLLYAREKLAWG